MTAGAWHNQRDKALVLAGLAAPLMAVLMIWSPAGHGELAAQPELAGDG